MDLNWGKHLAFVRNKARGSVCDSKVEAQDMENILGVMQKSQSPHAVAEWDDTTLCFIRTEIDNQSATNDCRSLADEVRTFKQDALYAYPHDNDPMRTYKKLGIKVLSKTVVEFFNAV